MALKIKLKRFTDSSGDPSTSDLEVGEVGINPVQKKIFVNNSGTIVALFCDFQQLVRHYMMVKHKKFR